MRRFVTVGLLAGYGLVLAYLTLSPQSRERLPAWSRLQLVPLETIGFFLRRGGWEMVVNVPGNLVAFMPLGFLWPVLRRGGTNAWRVGLLSAGVSLAIEAAQFTTARRIADVDDVLLNAIGGLLGYGAYRVVARCLRWVATALPAQKARENEVSRLGLTSPVSLAGRERDRGRSSRLR